MHREPGARKERGEGGLCAREPRGRHHPVKGRDVSSQYGGMDETCPLCTGGRRGGPSLRAEPHLAARGGDVSTVGTRVGATVERGGCGRE